ncbi:MAG: L-2-amino-thiazoline-4-carboxylic acid hydrolase [Candidatus Aminicenantes bacterium]|nr:MAG: L-2-amino-thiazoline-4-carboxylic acid hydrolase [Candidatus Aminicenantes bacterium]
MVKNLTAAYYAKNTRRFVKQFEKAFARYFMEKLAPFFSEDQLAQIKKKSIDTFILVLNELPFIGGDKNPMTQNLIQAAWFLSLYKVLKEYGKSTGEIGKLSYQIHENNIKKSPLLRLTLFLSSFFMFTKFSVRSMKKSAEKSQERLYPGDFIVEFVEGNGREFDFGLDTIQCPIYKVFSSQGAGDFTPYICDLDFLRSQYLRSGLHRSKTLAEGGEKCNFRWKRKRKPQKITP